MTRTVYAHQRHEPVLHSCLCANIDDYTPMISPVKRKSSPEVNFDPPKRGISLGGQLPYRLRATKHASARTHKGSNSLDQRKRPSISTLIGMPTVTLPHVEQNSTKVPCNENLIYEVHFAQRPTAKYSISSVSFFIITNQCTFFKLRLLHILLHQMAAI